MKSYVYLILVASLFMKDKRVYNNVSGKDGTNNMDVLNEIRCIEQSVKDCFESVSGRITTFTLYFRLNHVIRIQSIVDGYKSPKWTEVCSMMYPKLYIYVRIPGEKKNRNSNFKSFYNSTAVCIDGVVAKVFASGIHITGCKTMEGCQKVLQCLLCLLNTFCKTCDEISFVSYQIQMINILCCLDRDIPLIKLYEDWMWNDSVKCIYNRETYSGLRLKSIDPKVTLLCFQSGKIILSGAKNVEHLLYLKMLLKEKVFKILSI